MKNAIVQLCLVLLGVTSVHAVKLMQTSSLHVKVLPEDSADRILAIQGKDTIKMTGGDGEYIVSSLHPGPWRIRVEARKPFRNIEIINLDIKPGLTKDLGQVWLSR